MMLCEADRCTGCGACANACPVGCVGMKRDAYGFDRPTVDASRRVDCGRCAAACPQLSTKRGFRPFGDRKVFMSAIREGRGPIERSSSGGVAYALSRTIIERGGVVYGVAYGDDMRVMHVRVDDEVGLSRLQGSKYVQSYVGDSYRAAREDLRLGHEVLFIGVGCQIDGLYRFLGDERPSGLYTIDLLCGGGASPGVFESYIGALGEKYSIDIAGLNYRDKRYGYGYGYLVCALSRDGRSRIMRGSDAGFVKSMGIGYIRESCFSCPYARLERVSDLTLGDYWNVNVDEAPFNLGASLVIANSRHGLMLLESVGDMAWVEEKSVEEALDLKSNALRQRKTKPSDYEDFFLDAFNLKWDAVYFRHLRSPSLYRELFDSMPSRLIALVRHVRRKVRFFGR